jgi:hypothetical protein
MAITRKRDLQFTQIKILTTDNELYISQTSSESQGYFKYNYPNGNCEPLLLTAKFIYDGSENKNGQNKGDIGFENIQQV